MNDRIAKCLSLYEKFKTEDNANNLFKYFYEIEAQLKQLVKEQNEQIEVK